MFIYHNFFIFFLCHFFLIYASYSTEQGETANNIQQMAIVEEKKPDYETLTINVQKVTDEVKSIGIVKAFHEVEISPEISGRVKKIYYDVGDMVKQDDLVLELDGESKLIELKIKLALLQRTEAKYEKIKRRHWVGPS